MTVDDKLLLYLSIVIPSTFSVFGCLCVISIYFRYTRLQGFATNIVLILTFLSFCESLSQIPPTILFDIDPVYCEIQAWLIQFFCLCTIMWLTNISIIMYFEAFKPELCTEKYCKKSLIGIIMISGLVSVIPYIFHAYKEIKGQCYISKNHKFLRLIVYFIPLWCAIFIIAAMFYKIIMKLKKDPNTSSFALRLKYYPFILIIVAMPITCVRILDDLDIDMPVYFIMFAYCVFMLEGFINCLVFGYTENIRRAINESNYYNLLVYNYDLNK
ncbi:hypothetical protein SteCoe_27841 [Stentor coeruleus]|uniref:G-protein coupled receptors family 2 profile 2 domain-containing protein n=1 Tax=Stentor coeruleus TaxID=5963 RepID=A0A1R2B9K8_9CILI|nr:hypothetical protein SteCoe_27841 [Stentor coeruleus]